MVKLVRMNLEALFHQLLGLGESWRVESLRLDPGGETVEIRVRETPELWKQGLLSQEGGTLRPYGHAEERRWRHLEGPVEGPDHRQHHEGVTWR